MGTNENLVREDKVCKKNKGVSLLVIGAIFLLVCGDWWMVKQYIPYGMKTEYNFNGGVDIEKQIHVTTQPIFFPDILRHDGVFAIENDTGYQICVATAEEGFLFFEQGEFIIHGKPLVFFVVKPEAEENTDYNGQVTIRENADIGFVYSIQGNPDMIKEVSYKVEKN